VAAAVSLRLCLTKKKNYIRSLIQDVNNLLDLTIRLATPYISRQKQPRQWCSGAASRSANLLADAVVRGELSIKYKQKNQWSIEK
jgi:hypothetical protein